MPRIPFTIDTTGTEFTATRGSVRYDPPHLVIEYQTTDRVTGSPHRSALQEIRVPIGEVVHARVTRSWRGARLAVRTTSGRFLGGLPAPRPAEVTLRFRRRDRERASELAAALQRAGRTP